MVLVGIAGEDDLDAPDLATPANMSSEPQKPKPTGNGRLNSGQVGSPRRGSDAKPAKLILGLEASVELRDRFLAELSDLGSSDEMATWSHRRLAEKNRLTGADAERVEEAFRARLVTLATCTADAPPAQEAPPGGLLGQNAERPAPVEGSQQEPAGLARAPTSSGTGTMTGRSEAPLLDLRPAARRCPPPAVRSKPRPRTQGQ